MIPTLFALIQQAAPPPAGPAPTPGGGAGPLPGCGGGGLAQLTPMLLIFVVFYFMLIRPQQKKQRELQDWLKSIKKGDEVVTTGGIIGKISGMTDDVVTLEVQEKVRMRVMRSHIAGRAPGATPSKSSPEPDSKNDSKNDKSDKPEKAEKSEKKA